MRERTTTGDFSWGVGTMIDQQSYADALVAAGQQLSGGVEPEGVLLMLRERGFSQIDCVRGVLDLTGCSLAEAKGLVQVSGVWADVRERTEEFHRALVKEISMEGELWD
jgi:ribosomal protein L7/L12